MTVLNPKRIVAILLSLCASLALSAGEMTLVTTDGGRLRGDWIDGAKPDDVLWQSKDFVGPFEFPRDTIVAVYGPRDEDAEEALENLCICELVSGDVLLGMPVSLDEDKLVFAVESANAKDAIEKLSIPRKELKRLTAPMASNEVLIDLPGDGQALLKNKRGEWELEGGELVAKSVDAKCFTKLPELPQRCLLEFEVSWDRGTDFSVCLTPQKREVQGNQNNGAARVRRFGGGNNVINEVGQHSGLRLESWDDKFVMMARTASNADVLLIDGSSKKAGSMRLQIFIDAGRQTADIYRDGIYSGQLKLPEEFKTEWARLSEVARLESFAGSLSLESYRISSWNGHTPISGGEGSSSVRLTDGTTVTGDIEQWDPRSSEFVVKVASAGNGKSKEEGSKEKNDDKKEGDEQDREESDESEKEEGDEKSDKKEEQATMERIAMEDMAEIVFGGVRVAKKEKDLDEKPEAGSVSITTKRGSRFDGEYMGVKDNRVFVKSIVLDQTTSFDVSEIAAVHFSGLEKPEASAVVGTLRLGNSMMRGRLMEGKSTDDATCLAWQPLAAKNAVALVAASSGTIIYRAPKKKAPKPKPQANVRRRGVIAGFAQALRDVTKEVDGKIDQPQVAPVKATDLMTLELRSGDSIPFRPKRIDEDGVTFESPLSEVTFVSHEQVKAISLRARCTPAELTAIKRERLLTVPRRYKERPPTHLLLSVNKDILRGRLLSMDDKTVILEIALTPRRIPRERIAAIVWLDGVVDPDAEAEGSGDPPKKDSDESVADEAQPQGFHVLATKRGGQRITILPDRCKDSVLHGKNPVLEACQLDLSEVDQLAFGSDIDAVVGKLAVSQIVLTAATQPRFMDDEDEEGGGGETGQESSLVGKPAPPIELERLNGKEYDLSKETGKIVVLDFWATWCGPCIQWMPRAEAVVNEFPEDNVELVAVNLSETADEINPVLKRLDLHPTVILDIDGVAANAYNATAIPQTVVIDREGKVDRVLVGGGKQNEERLRDAIKSLVNPGA